MLSHGRIALYLPLVQWRIQKFGRCRKYLYRDCWEWLQSLQIHGFLLFGIFQGDQEIVI